MGLAGPRLRGGELDPPATVNAQDLRQRQGSGQHPDAARPGGRRDSFDLAQQLLRRSGRPPLERRDPKCLPLLERLAGPKRRHRPQDGRPHRDLLHGQRHAAHGHRLLHHGDPPHPGHQLPALLLLPRRRLHHRLEQQARQRLQRRLHPGQRQRRPGPHQPGLRQLHRVALPSLPGQVRRLVPGTDLQLPLGDAAAGHPPLRRLQDPRSRGRPHRQPGRLQLHHQRLPRRQHPPGHALLLRCGDRRPAGHAAAEPVTPACELLHLPGLRQVQRYDPHRLAGLAGQHLQREPGQRLRRRYRSHRGGKPAHRRRHLRLHRGRFGDRAGAQPAALQRRG